jgi:hypothetical protein
MAVLPLESTTYTDTMTPQDKQAFGEGGNFTMIASDGAIDLGASNLRAVAIQCIGDVTFTNLVDEFERVNISGTPADDGSVEYANGFTLYGSFTTIHLATGAARVTLASDRK